MVALLDPQCSKALNFVSGSELSGVFPAIKSKSDLKMRSKEIYIYIIYTGILDMDILILAGYSSTESFSIFYCCDVF